MVAGRVAEDRAGVRLGERLLLHALVRHLLDLAHRRRAVALGAAEARPHADDRRALERARAVRVRELVHAGSPGVAVQVHERRVDERVGGLPPERSGVPVHRTADGAGHGRHPLEAEDPRARRHRRDVRERRAGRGVDRRAVDGRIAPRVLQDDAADPFVGDQQVRAAAQHEDRQLVLTGDGDRAGEVALVRDAQEEVRRTADAKRRVRREALAAGAERRGRGHTAARSRRSSSARSPAGRMSPAPRTSTRSPGSARSATIRAAASASGA